MSTSNHHASPRRFPTFRARLLGLVVAAFPAISILAVPPQVAVQAGQIVVSGLVPGTAVALISVGSVPKPLYPAGASFSALLTDDDVDGRVLFLPEGGVPWRSIWIAVDLATGEYAVGAPDRFPKRAMQPPAEIVRRGNLGQMNKLWNERAVLHLLVVRPGEGAWTRYVSKGAIGDDDKNHRPGFSTSLEHFRPLGGNGAPPHNFRRGDVIVALDPINLEYYAMTLGNLGE